MAEQVATRPDFSKISVLLLEDDFVLADVTGDTLRGIGVEVHGPFASEASAMRSAREHEPDCAIIDINLGDGPTYELARLLKARGVPFVFMTGYDPALLPDEFHDVEHLQKPMQVRQIVQALDRLI